MKNAALALLLSALLAAPLARAAECGADGPGSLTALTGLDDLGPAPEPLPPIGAGEARFVTLNVENLFDEYCGGPDDPNCPGSGHDWLPERPGDYAKRISKLAVAVSDWFGLPDVIALQEIEAQDFCREGGSLYGTCGPGMGDGRPDVLQDAAEEIFRRTGVRYQAAADMEGTGDERGIMNGFLYRTDRVEMLPAEGDPILQQNPQGFDWEASPEVAADGKGEKLFRRALQLARFRITPDGPGTPGLDVYAIAGHYKSNPEDFHMRRAAQVFRTTELAQKILTQDRNAAVLVMLDSNTPYDRDLAGLSRRLVSLNNRVDPSAGNYTYIHRGRRNTLDRIFASAALAAQVRDVRPVHIATGGRRHTRWNPEVPDHLTDHDAMSATVGVTAAPQERRVARRPAAPPVMEPVREEDGSLARADFTGLSGEALRARLHDYTARERVRLDYGEARHWILAHSMDSRGYVWDAYGQREARTRGPLPEVQDVNIEHTWPQSRFRSGWGGSGRKSGEAPRWMKSDLHNLYPVDYQLNEARGSNPFGEIAGCPPAEACATKELFDPPDAHKGNVARTLFYMSVRYELPIPEPMRSMLQRWNRLDPPDQAERARNDAIEEAQGNRNPFVDDPGLMDRL